MFKKTVHRAKREIRKIEDWATEIDGYDVAVVREDDDLVSVSIWPNDWRRQGHVDRLRLPVLKFYPKHVKELEALAELLPSVLRQLAAGMRVEELIDLRSRFDREMDQHDAEIARIVKDS